MKGVDCVIDNIKRIQELVKQLNQYRHEYYNLNSPSISDLEYDKKFDELKSLEDETKFIISNSPTQTVGYEVVSKLQKVEHPIPLKSLDKETDIVALRKFIGNINCLLMLKNDGLTVELLYESGLLIQASTRGDSFLGEDITHNANTFKNIPKTISYLGKLRLAGEAIIHWNDFNEMNENLTDDERRKLPSGKYKTPRNLVAGSVRQLDSKICANRNVCFYAFNLLESDMGFKTKSEQLRWLESLGFAITPYAMLTPNTLVLEESIKDMRDLAEEMNVPIDGLVCAMDDIAYGNSLGETAHHPLHSMAFKFEQEMETSILRDIEWQIGRTSVITPVAIFDSVELDGTDVSRASVHNLSILRKLKLGIGDEIVIVKANQIIPQIVDNLTKSNNVIVPETCPVCGFDTEIRNTGTADFLYCTNDGCPAKMLDKFVNFTKRDAMNIEGLSEATLSKLINKGFIKTFADIYRLEQYKSQIVKMEGSGQKSCQKLIDSIEKSKNVSLTSLVLSLGIEQVGKGGASRLAKHFENNLDWFINAINNDYDFTKIEDFGEITANAVHEYFRKEDNMEQFMELLEYVNILQDSKSKLAKTESPFSGKRVYCTGTFTCYKKKELQDILESLGANFASGYAKSLDYLIVGSIKGSSKEDKARKDGVPILTEGQFLTMIGRA